MADSRIFSQYAPEPVPFMDIGQLAERRQVRQINDLKLEQAKREADAQRQADEAAAREQQLLQQAFSQFRREDGMPDEEQIVTFLYPTSPKLAQAVQTSFTKLRKDAAEAQKSEWDTQSAKATKIAQLMQGATPENWPSVVARAKALDPNLTLSPQFDPAARDLFVAEATSTADFNKRAKEILDQQDSAASKFLNFASLARNQGDLDLANEFAALHNVDPAVRKAVGEQWTPEIGARAGALSRTPQQRATDGADSTDFTLNPGSKRFNAAGQVIAAVPPTASAAGGGFTLSPGATRYDAQGNPVASAPNRPPQAATGRPVLSGQATQIADYNTSLDDLDVLTTTLTGNQATGTSAKVGAMLPNAITDLTGWGTSAKSKQAVIDRVKQVIGKALEGGVLRKEDESKYEKILPTIADPPEVVRSKLAGLKSAIEKRRVTLLDSLEDAGYDVSRYRARSEARSGEGGEKSVTTAELQAIATRKGTTLEQEKQRAAAAGYIVR